MTQASIFSTGTTRIEVAPALFKYVTGEINERPLSEAIDAEGAEGASACVRNERSCSVKATGMYAIAGVALFVIFGGMYCTPPCAVVVREDRRGYSGDEEVRPARSITILHRWDDREAAYEDAEFDYSGSPESCDDSEEPGDEDDEYRPGPGNGCT